MHNEIEYEAPTWDQVYDMMIDLCEKVWRSGFNPDLIIGVSRGGWPPARIMSDFLDNKNLANLKVEFYVDIEKTGKRPVIIQPVSASVKGKQVLIVDDVSDTGHSLKTALAHVRKSGAKAVKTLTVYYKPKSILKPDFYARRTSKWVIFPWERFEVVKALVASARKNEKTRSWIKNQLVRGGLKERLVDRLIDLAGRNS